MSKRPIKMCGGFDAPVCKYCKRKASTHYRLVNELTINESTGFRACEHFLH